MGHKCFFVEPTQFVRLSLRRFSFNSKCSHSGLGVHNASIDIGRDKSDSYLTQDGHVWGSISHSHDDERWPTHCACGYFFSDEDEWQCNVDIEYTSQDKSWVGTLHELPVGAMYYAPWLEGHKRWCGPDGKSLWVMTPGGLWSPDQKASNCTKKDDHEHKCWIRHGAPPNITVDKNGNTCGAGAGSIVIRDYHGFLQNGELT